MGKKDEGRKGASFMRRFLNGLCLVLLFVAFIFVSGCDKDSTSKETLGKAIPSKSEKVGSASVNEEKIKIGFSMDTLLEER